MIFLKILSDNPTGAQASQAWAGIGYVDTRSLGTSEGINEFEQAVTLDARNPDAAVGLAGGREIPTTTAPFLLRGVNLLGIDSVMQPFAPRVGAWARLARDLPLDKLHAMVRPATLADLPHLGADNDGEAGPGAKAGLRRAVAVASVE